MVPKIYRDLFALELVSNCNSRRWFASVKDSSGPNEKVDFIFGFSIESNAKIKHFKSIGSAKLFLWQFENCRFRQKTLSPDFNLYGKH